MNKKWGNIDPDFDNDNTINGWKLKVLDVEFFRLERPNMSSFDTDEIQTAINSSLALLDAECNGLIQEVWFITDVESKFYRTGKEKNYIREAAIMQTQYFINLGNDYTDGSTSFNASGISASFQRPLDKKNIAPGVFILLQKGRVYELQSYDLGGNNFGKKPTANSLVNYVQFGVGDVRYVTYNQMPYNRQEGSLLYVEKGEIKFFTVEQLDLTVPRAYLLWDKATKSFEDIHDVKDIAFFGNQLDNAITRQEAEELIAASPSGVSKEYVDDGLALKQNTLTAGTGIDITDNVISSTGGGGSGDVTLDTAQNITGIKTFTNGIKNNLVEVDGKSLIIKNSNTAASYLEVESVYSGSGYKNWFGIQLFRTTGTSRSRLANLEIRQDDGLYIACVNDVSIQGSNIKFNNVRLQQVGAPTADYDAATKKYADDGLALKQNKLTAGTNITITDDVISATGDVTLDTDQTITGEKTFEKGIFFEKIAEGKSDTKIENSRGALVFYDRGTLALKLSSTQVVFANQRLLYIGNPTDATDAVNKRYADNGLALKQNTLTAGTGIDITGDVISATGDVTLDTDQTITGEKTFEKGIFFEKIAEGKSDTKIENSRGALVFYDRGTLALKLSSTQVVFANQRLLYIGNPTDATDAVNKRYADNGLALKQNTLTAGTGIDITGDVISSTGGTGTGDVTLDTDQTITGIKTFSNGLNTNLLEINGNPLIMKNSGAGSAYFKIEQVYNSGYKNWFGLNFIRTESGTQILTSVIEVRQDNSLYIVSTNDLLFTANNIKFGNARLQGVRTPAADDDATTKKYVDDAIAAALRPYRKES